MKETTIGTFDAIGRGAVTDKLLRFGFRGYVEFEETDTGIWINYLHVQRWARRQGVATAMLTYLYAKGKTMHRGHLLASGQCLAKVHERLRKIYVANNYSVVAHS